MITNTNTVHHVKDMVLVKTVENFKVMVKMSGKTCISVTQNKERICTTSGLLLHNSRSGMEPYLALPSI